MNTNWKNNSMNTVCIVVSMDMMAPIIRHIIGQIILQQETNCPICSCHIPDTIHSSISSNILNILPFQVISFQVSVNSNGWFVTNNCIWICTFQKHDVLSSLDSSSSILFSSKLGKLSWVWDEHDDKRIDWNQHVNSFGVWSVLIPRFHHFIKVCFVGWIVWFDYSSNSDCIIIIMHFIMVCNIL